MMTTYEVHPAIGIARLGSSRLDTDEGSFLGPEPNVSPPAKYRDASGDLKRQAARFRVFACRRDEQHQLVHATELTLDDARKITWTVHLANRKGVARRQYGTRPGFRNNATGRDERDARLIIDPGPRSVTRAGECRVFDSGRFRDVTVPLGEITMEPGGRLRVLGGYGRSGSAPPQSRLDLKTGHFADNDNWFDDVSDGPVTAAVELSNGAIVEATAWVIVGPPDFAPGIKNLLTLYDLLFDLAVKRGVISSPARPPGQVSFTRHVRPILDRALGYRWVNRAAAFGYDNEGTGHAPGGSGDFARLWGALADSSQEHRRLRESLAGRLRNPDPQGPRPEFSPLELIPRLSAHEWLGSGSGNVLPLTATQYQIMQAWAAGDFINDLGKYRPEPELLPDALTRIALEGCVGGALYPGVEVNGYIMNFPERFMEGEPFRISPEAVKPGEVTQYNGVPWQADFLYCRWEETEGRMWKRLGWWPAQRPDDVYTDVGATEMVPWDRGLGPDYQEMIDKWDRLGMVIDRGSSGSTFFIEQERDSDSLGP